MPDSPVASSLTVMLLLCVGFAGAFLRTNPLPFILVGSKAGLQLVLAQPRDCAANQTKSSSIKPNQSKSDQIQPNQTTCPFLGSPTNAQLRNPPR
jgi:hypothetical protein